MIGRRRPGPGEARAGSEALLLFLAFLTGIAVPARALSPVYPRPTPAPMPQAPVLPVVIPKVPTGLPATILPLPAPGLVPSAPQPVFGNLPLLRHIGGELEDGEDPGVSLGELWDGLRRGEPAPVGVPAEIPVFLDVESPGDRRFVADAVLAARASRSGRRVLARVEALTSRRGRPVKVVVKDLGGDWGEYDYIKDVLELHSRFKDDPVSAAPTLVHELLHVLQHEEGIPAEALEMELEAHIVTLDVMRELGLEAESDTFSAEAARRLAQGPKEYVAWLKDQLPGKLLLAGSDFETLEAQLEEEVSELEQKLERRESPRTQERLQWALHDLALVRSLEGRARSGPMRTA